MPKGSWNKLFPEEGWLKPEPLMSFNSEAEDMWLVVMINGVKVFLSCIYLSPGDEYASASFVSKLE